MLIAVFHTTPSKVNSIKPHIRENHALTERSSVGNNFFNTTTTSLQRMSGRKLYFEPNQRLWRDGVPQQNSLQRGLRTCERSEAVLCGKTEQLLQKFVLGIVDAAVKPVFRHKFRVSALFHNFAVVHNQNYIGVHNGGKTVRNDETGSAY